MKIVGRQITKWLHNESKMCDFLFVLSDFLIGRRKYVFACLVGYISRQNKYKGIPRPVEICICAHLGTVNNLVVGKANVVKNTQEELSAFFVLENNF